MPIRQDTILALAQAANKHVAGLSDLVATIQAAAKRCDDDLTYSADDALASILAMVSVCLPPPASTSLIATALQHYTKNYKRNKYAADRMARLRHGSSQRELRDLRAEVLGRGQAAAQAELSLVKRERDEIEIEIEIDDEVEPQSGIGGLDLPTAKFAEAEFVPFSKRPTPTQAMSTDEALELARQIAQDKADEAEIMAEFAKAQQQAKSDEGA